MPITINGTSGVSLAGQFDSASSFGFKNRIINGQMQIAQRATSATITAGSTIAAGYSTVDRFYVYCTGANVTAAQVAGSGAIKNNLQITGAASVTAIGVGQRIESLNSYDMAGSTATLSVNLANSLLTTVTWTASYATTTADTFGTLAAPTVTQIATGSFTVTSTLTNYSTQITIPAAATTGLQIVFTVGAQVSGTWTIGNVQLEKSSIATSFDYRPYGAELALAQRYYFRAQADDTSYLFGVGGARSTTEATFVGNYPVPMRISPTALEQNGTAAHYTVQTGGVDRSSSAVVAYNGITTQQLYAITTTVASGQTAGQAGFVYGQNLTAYLGWSAEL
tara:strand:- start:1621 stop:2631 length:1011 start_codon:yes stop_codon:yes gene_type:complete